MGKQWNRVLERLDNLKGKWNNLNSKGKFVVMVVGVITISIIYNLFN